MSDSFPGLPPELVTALTQKGFTNLTSVQKAVAESDSNQADLRILSQTGSGKTVAVGIALARMLLVQGPRGTRGAPPSAIVLTPTRELAMQVQRELAWLLANVPDASVEVVTGGTAVFAEKKALERGPRVVVGTPGRALDHLTTGALRGDDVKLVILDEADQMLDMGFRDELEGILDKMPGRERTHLVSATFSGEVLAVAKRYQSNPVILEGSPIGVANSDIEHLVHVVPMRHRYDALVNILLLAGARRDEDEGRTLVFTRTRADTIEIAEALSRDGFSAEPLSGDLAQAQRTRTLTAFRSGRIGILVATDVAARGLDVQGIDLVVHLDPPSDPDSFTHRSGRTGRAGKKGTSILLLPPQARRRIERMLHDANVKPNWAPLPTAEKIEKAYQKLGRRRVFDTMNEQFNEEQLAYAEKLLSEVEDPKKLVAALLTFAEVKPPCHPHEVQAISPLDVGPHQRGGHPGRRDGPPRGRPFEPRNDGPRGPHRPQHDAGPDRGRTFHPAGERNNRRPAFEPHTPPRDAGFRPRDFGPKPRRFPGAEEGGAPRPDFDAGPRFEGGGAKPKWAPRSGSTFEAPPRRPTFGKKRG